MSREKVLVWRKGISRIDGIPKHITANSSGPEVLVLCKSKIYSIIVFGEKGTIMWSSILSSVVLVERGLVLYQNQWV